MCLRHCWLPHRSSEASLRLVVAHAVHSKLDKTCLSSPVLPNNEGVGTFALCWYDERPYFFDKAFAFDGSFNILKFWSLFELLIDCRFACRFVLISPTFCVPF